MKKSGKEKIPADREAKLPVIKRDICKFLTAEEAKITARGLVTGAVTLFSLGVATTEALAVHTSIAGHGSAHNNATYDSGNFLHRNIADAGGAGRHTSQTAHVNTHSSVADPHSSHGSHGQW